MPSTTSPAPPRTPPRDGGGAQQRHRPRGRHSLTVTAVTNGANGSVTIDATSGNPVYTPNLNFVGTDTFTYTISDGNGGTDTATVSVTVGPNANDAPDAINDIASTTEDTPVTVVAQQRHRPRGRHPDGHRRHQRRQRLGHD
ncbi:MAG: cadherin-like domain-containing protein [Rhodoferax sp.]|nr:cadherin-like domain-containing protein [Rhodoferax sp.]